jgi:hypothetical protein
MGESSVMPLAYAPPESRDQYITMSANIGQAIWLDIGTIKNAD